jgi:MFS family permease
VGTVKEQGVTLHPPNNGSFNALIITLLVQVMVVAAVLAPTVIAPAITSDLMLPDSAVGIFVSIVYITAIGSTLYSGTLISKWGAIRISQVGLALCAAGEALISTGVPVLGLAGAAIIGLGYGPITPASSHILIRTTPAKRLSTVFSIKQTGVPLGGVLVGFLIPPQEVAYGWQWALLSVSVGCLVMSVVAQCVRSELDEDRSSLAVQSFIADIVRPIRLVIAHPTLRVLAACSFVFAGVQLTLTTYLSTYLHLSLEWSLLAAGVALAVTQAAGMVGRILWGAIADARLGARKVLVLLNALMVASSLGIAMFGADTHRFWVFAVLMAFGASAVGWNGVYLAQVARLAPEGKAGLATGGTLAFSFFGTVLWAPAFGMLVSATGSYQVSFLSFSLPLLICLVCMAKLRFA